MRPLLLGAGALVAALTLAATAQAGTLSRDAGGVLTFTAGAGETNDLEMRWPRVAPFCGVADPCVRVSDAGAPVGFGALSPADVGCALNPTGIECTSNAATATVGTGDDRARVSVDTTATILGGPGDDDLAARGEAGSASVYGGPGDDRLEADGEGGEVEGGPGSDYINAVWNVPVARGGPGSDEIHFLSQFSDGDLHGNAGDDRILPVALRGGSVSGGNGADEVVIGAVSPFGVPGWNVGTGNGADSIDVSGGRADTVACGNGRDRVRADAADVIAGDCEVVEIV